MTTTQASKNLDNGYNDDFEYLLGFGSHFQSEKIKGALPKGQNSPQLCPFGLYAEQLNGTAFTAPRVYNQRTYVDQINKIINIF